MGNARTLVLAAVAVSFFNAVSLAADDPSPRELFSEAIQLFFDGKPVEAARGRLLPVGEDHPVPMKEILDLYAGRCEPAAVLSAAQKGDRGAQRNQLCYGHLYLGLFYEAQGDAEKAREHIAQAAGPYRMDHSMGKVAVMHANLRGWPVESGERFP